MIECRSAHRLIASRVRSPLFLSPLWTDSSQPIVAQLDPAHMRLISQSHTVKTSLFCSTTMKTNQKQNPSLSLNFSLSLSLRAYICAHLPFLQVTFFIYLVFPFSLSSSVGNKILSLTPCFGDFEGRISSQDFFSSSESVYICIYKYIAG